jgi:hypothetical protein
MNHALLNAARAVFATACLFLVGGTSVSAIGHATPQHHGNLSRPF